MKHPLTISLAALGGIAVLGATAVAWAQADRAPQGPGQPPAYGAPPNPAGPRLGERMRERREERVRLLHDALNLRPDQEGAWRSCIRCAEHAGAIKRFYAVLDQAQRRTFDALVQLHQDRMGGGGRRHGGELG